MIHLVPEARRLLKLAAPMMVAQGGLMTMGLVDTLLIGRVSVLDMGAVSLGNTIAAVIMVLGLGLLMGIEPLAAHAHGAGQTDRARALLGQGLWLALIASIPLCGLLLLALFGLAPAGIDPDLIGATSAYVWARLPGVPFNLLFGACRSFLTSVERVRPVLVAVVLANLLNAALDAVLLFVFDLGAVGIGLATSGSWALMFALLAAASRRVPGAAGAPAGLLATRPIAQDILQICALGWPIGLQLGVEVGMFAAVGVFIARFGEVSLAGHHIALTLASLSFMAAVGLAVAATTRVGMHLGAGRPEDARRAGFIAIAIGAAVMGASGLLFVLFPEALARLFAPEAPEVVRVGAALLRIAAVFAISDGIQVVAAGSLRGAKDTRWPFYTNAFGHWAIGLPVALWLGLERSMEAEGFWWALSVGLTFVAVVLTARFAYKSRVPA